MAVFYTHFVMHAKDMQSIWRIYL